MKQKIGTNQIKSIGRTKKLGPTINEHRNEKTYLKNWNLGALWKKIYINFRWWDVERRQTRRDFDKRVRWTRFWLRVFWQPMRGASPIEWRFRCLNEWPPMRVSSLVEWGFQCLKEESVWEWEWVILVSEWVFESVRVTSEIFDSVFEWFWSFKIWVFVTRVYNQVL